MLESVRQRGHRQPTAIQSGAIPIALSGRDLIATAETGSGKTAAFLLPILNRLHGGEQSNRIGALVLAPTRELAFQIGEEFRLLSRNTRMRAAVIVGGESIDRQIRELRAGVQLVVACPGRLVDHLDRGTVKLDRIEVVVIDEADRMLDMGFLPQLRRVLRTVRKPHQTLMFSATMSTEVERIGSEFLSNPARVRVGNLATPPSAIRQAVYAATPESKMPVLMHLLGGDGVSSAIVFTRTKSRADRVAKMLVRNQFKAVAIHGDRSQSQRTAALTGFRKGQYAVLVATDVAARGLDIPDVSHVINFDLPEEPASYIHRIGRTARMGKSGTAFSLVMPEDGLSLRGIERALGMSLERAKLSGFREPEVAAVGHEQVARAPIGRHAVANIPRRKFAPRKTLITSGQR
jgi:ATP-dependent RNA helicase RhlE